MLKEGLRVLKPGGFALLFSSPREDVFSRMVQRLEQAGFVVNFSPIFWTYIRGFPKSYNVGKNIAKKLGREIKALEGAYAGCQLKPAVEIIIVAMKPIRERSFTAEALATGKGVTWLDDCRIPYPENDPGKDAKKGKSNKRSTASQTIKGRHPANLLVLDKVLDYGRRPFSEPFDLDAWFRKKVDFSALPPAVRHCWPFLDVPKPSRDEKEAGLDHLPPKRVSDGRKKACDNPFQRGATLRKNIHPTVKPIKR